MAKEATKSSAKGGSASGRKKVEELVAEIGKLSVLELSELVSQLQEKLGVTPQMAPAPAPSGAGPAAGAPEAGQAPAPAPTATVVLTEAGANKIAVIKALREIKPDLGLKEAKDITEATPKEILVSVKMEEAQAAQKKLTEAGAKVELK